MVKRSLPTGQDGRKKKKLLHTNLHSFVQDKLEKATRAQRLMLAEKGGLVVSGADRKIWEERRAPEQAHKIVWAWISRQVSIHPPMTQSADPPPPRPPIEEIRVHVRQTGDKIVVSIDGKVALTMGNVPQEVSTHHALSAYRGPPLPLK